MAADKLHPKAQQLLDAHVAFLVEQLDEQRLREHLGNQLDAFLEDAGDLRLKEVVSASTVKKTVHKYAIDMTLGGAIPALVGKIARRIYRHKAHDRTTLNELMPDSAFEEFLDKTLEMESFYQALVHESVTNPIYASMISDLLFSGIQEFVANIRVAERLPGGRAAVRMGKALAKRTRPEIGAELEEAIHQFINRSTRKRLKSSEQFLLHSFESERFRELVLDLWDDNKHLKVAIMRDYASSQDIEEFFVIIYEYWQHLRRTKFFRAIVDTGIDAFFATYDNTSLRELLDEVGVTREMMLEDAMRFAPPVIAHLKERDMLDRVIRRNLEGFYASDAVDRILG